MQKYLPWVFTATILVGVGGMTYYFYKAYSSIEIEKIDVQKDYSLDSEVITTDGKGWLGELAKTKSGDFTLPTTELQIRLEGNSTKNFVDAYRIEVDKLDSYKFFCLNQILRANNIGYSYYKKDGYIRLVITVIKEVDLEKILKEIKRYGIDYKLEKTLGKE